MKRIVIIFTSLASLIVVAQSLRLPIKTDQYVDVPLQPPRHVVEMTGNVIAPVGSRFDYSKTVVEPTLFTLGTFKLDEDVCIWLENPGSNRMIWPAEVFLPYGPLPTNAGGAMIWFKNVRGKIWAMP